MAGISKPPIKLKRVRTGCLTCRERHLKCDEALPVCLNCQKSTRKCKRGVRLNFIQIDVHQPRFMALMGRWKGELRFYDESRQIASEYKGGNSKYQPLDSNDLSENILEMEECLLRGVADKSSKDNVALEPEIREYLVSGVERQPIPERRVVSSLLSTYDVSPRHQVEVRVSGHVHTQPGTMTKSDMSYQIVSQQLTMPLTPYSGTLLNELPPIEEDMFSPRAVSVSMVSRMMLPPQNRTGSRVTSRERERERPQNNLTPISEARMNNENSNNITSQNGQNNQPAQSSLEVVPNNSDEREFLGSTEEVLYMQLFIEEVGVSMDSFDREKHFSELSPYDALKSPMLLNAFLACGAKHHHTTNDDNQDNSNDKQESKPSCYFNTATMHLLRSLQNPDRNIPECAIAAVVLHVYEIMCDIPRDRMIHIAGARALIRECGWNASSTGIGATCFWLDVGVEVLNSLTMNWETSDPDQWGLDMDFEIDENDGKGGNEELWVKRIFYILAKVANFRASTPQLPVGSVRERIMCDRRHWQWQQLRQLCHDWNNAAPRTMRPLGYLEASQMQGTSQFPKIWLIKRPATLGQLFYHTTQCILCQTNPLEKHTQEMYDEAVHHARQVCGIVANTKDRYITAIATCALGIAGSTIYDSKERAEIIRLLHGINATGGWGSQAVERKLKKAWGLASLSSTSLEEIDKANPLKSADFKLPNHPYQGWYEPPGPGALFRAPLHRIVLT